MPGRTRTVTAPAAKVANTTKKTTKATSTVASKQADSKPATAKVNGADASAAGRKRKADVETDEKPAEVEEPKQKKTKVDPLKETTANGAAKTLAKTAAKVTKPAAPNKITKTTATKKNKISEPTLDVITEKLAAVEIPILAASPTTDNETAKTLPVQKKKTAAKAVPKAPHAHGAATAIGKKINDAPTQRLDVYVFGEGSSGELGLGSRRLDGKKPIDVKRPRLNPKLAAATVGVVQVACGGMHVVALTHDNKILTWGVNDQGALGRDTTWEGGLRDADKEDDSDDDDDDDTGINPVESTPTAVPSEHFPEGTKFVQVVAGDSASFALTEDGKVYGWGTFRSADGILGFTEQVRIQTTPALIPGLKNIKALAAGSNHILALDDKGAVVAWGSGQQNQLGRRIIERSKMSSLTPQGLGFPRRNKIVKIACGSYHSFALDAQGNVWGWGLNNFGETGIEQGAGDDEAAILKPAIITTLEEHRIVDIAGGEHHSVACDDQGRLLAWGRVDGHQVGVPLEKLNKDNTIYDERNQPRILFEPTVLTEVPNVVAVSAGTDNNFAITADGKAYSWGFSGNYQTGQGTIEDIETPTLIDNTAVRGQKLVGAGAGGQYSMLFGIPGAGAVNGA